MPSGLDASSTIAPEKPMTSDTRPAISAIERSSPERTAAMSHDEAATYEHYSMEYRPAGAGARRLAKR